MEINKDIWIWNHYATKMFFQKGGRHYCFAKYLSKLGYKVTIFCASTIHNSNENVISDKSLFFEEKDPYARFVFVKASNYNGNGMDRILNMISFYKNIFKVASMYVQKEGKPKVILASSMHPLTLVAGIKFGKKYTIPCICEVRDLWPASIVAYSRFTDKNIIIKILYRGERWIYTKSDALIFTMEGGIDYLKDKGWLKHIDKEKVFNINNGVDLEAFNENMSNFVVDDVDLDNKNKFKVVYAGSIRRVNNVGFLVECAKEFQNRKNERILFIIYGSGNELEFLRQKARELNLKNILFKGQVNKQYIPSILCRSNLNLVNADENIKKVVHYGNSSNKLFEYLASGKPVLCSFSEEKYSIIEKNKAGIAQNITDPKEYCDIIEDICNYPLDKYLEVCSFAKKTAEQYSFEKLTGDLIKVFDYVGNH